MGLGLEVFDERGRFKNSSSQIIPRILMYDVIRTDSASGYLTHELFSAGGRIVPVFVLVSWNGEQSKPSGMVNTPNEFSKWSISGNTLSYDLKWDGFWGGHWGGETLYKYLKYTIFAI